MLPGIEPFGATGTALAIAAGIVAGLGCAQAGLGALLLRRFVGKPPADASAGAPLPAVTVLKPLHGDEPMLSRALESFCLQDYPDYQIVFGVQDPSDPAIAVVRALQARHPRLSLDLVVSEAQHGSNRKISNLINMLPAARHDVLVMSDSDIHAEPGYLRAVVQALARPGIGLVTTLYGGIPCDRGLVRRMAAAQVNHNFLPGVLMSRLMGRQDCLGATMALRRDTLAAIGGLATLSPHLADDSALGRAVRQVGGAIAIADTMTRTTISDGSLRAMVAHELRWGRTVRSVEPVGYGFSSLQLPLFWASLAVLLAPLSGWSWMLLLLVWLWRAVAARSIDHAVIAGQAGQAAMGDRRGSSALLPVLLLPLRDWISALVMLNSFRGRTVDWRGHVIALPTRGRAVAALTPVTSESDRENEQGDPRSAAPPLAHAGDVHALSQPVP